MFLYVKAGEWVCPTPTESAVQICASQLQMIVRVKTANGAARAECSSMLRQDRRKRKWARRNSMMLMSTKGCPLTREPCMLATVLQNSSWRAPWRLLSTCQTRTRKAVRTWVWTSNDWLVHWWYNVPGAVNSIYIMVGCIFPFCSQFCLAIDKFRELTTETTNQTMVFFFCSVYSSFVLCSYFAQNLSLQLWVLTTIYQDAISLKLGFWNWKFESGILK